MAERFAVSLNRGFLKTDLKNELRNDMFNSVLPMWLRFSYTCVSLQNSSYISIHVLLVLSYLINVMKPLIAQTRKSMIDINEAKPSLVLALINHSKLSVSPCEGKLLFESWNRGRE